MRTKNIKEGCASALLGAVAMTTVLSMCAGEPDKELQSKQKVWDVLQPDMQVDSRGVANYKGCCFQVRGRGLCRAPSLTNCSIR